MNFLLMHNSVITFTNHKCWSTELDRYISQMLAFHYIAPRFFLNYIHNYYYQAHQKKPNYLETVKLTLPGNFPKFCFSLEISDFITSNRNCQFFSLM